MDLSDLSNEIVFNEMCRADAHEVIDLPEIAQRSHLDEIQDKFAADVLSVFKTANSWVLIALTLLSVIDEVNIVNFNASYSDRIVNHQVIMALIGATTVQVGAIAVTIANHIFRKNRGR